MKVDIHYGDGNVSLEIPEANVANIIRPWQDEEQADNQAILRQALTATQAEDFQKTIAGTCALSRPLSECCCRTGD